MSSVAMKVTEKGRLKPLKNSIVKVVRRFFDMRTKRWTIAADWHGCFNYTRREDEKRGILTGVSGFMRRREAC